MKTLALAALAALSAIPAAAQSADPVPFSGPFVGVQGGWQQDRQKFDITGTSAGTPYELLFTNNKSGFAYGGQIGFDYHITPDWVLGAEAAATGRTGTGNYTDGYGNAYSIKAGRTFDVTARLGYLVVPNGLLYVRGGYSNAKFIANFDGDNGSVNKGGYVAGVGYEQYLTTQISARLEYDYSHYGSDNYNDAAVAAGLTGASARYTRNAVKAGVDFHF